MGYKEIIELHGLAKNGGLLGDYSVRTMIAVAGVTTDPEIYSIAKEYINFKLRNRVPVMDSDRDYW